MRLAVGYAVTDGPSARGVTWAERVGPPRATQINQ
jgi:hypothetical protein